MLNRPNNSFAKATAAAAIMISSVLPFAMANGADRPQCLDLEQAENGQTCSAGASALGYSKMYPGKAVVAAIPGADVGDMPSIIANFLRLKGAESDFYINNEACPSGGTTFSFYVAGIAVAVDGKQKFGIADLQGNEGLLKIVANEANTAGMLLAEQTPDSPILASN